MELDSVVLYQDDSGNSTMMSDRVSGLASSIYREFERLIEKYDEDVVKELMPLVVAVLENLDSVFAVNQEHEVELELLKEDNEQLVTQYEREKALRKHAEEVGSSTRRGCVLSPVVSVEEGSRGWPGTDHLPADTFNPGLEEDLLSVRYIALEDSQDGEKKDLQGRLVMLESHSRHLELKTKNYADQISRLEEREADLKKEYNALHLRHTEMIHSYMEHLERTKHQHPVTPAEPPDIGTSSKARKDRPISMGIFHLPGSNSVTPDLEREPVDTPSEPWRFNNLSHPRSNTSLKSAEQFCPIRVEGDGTQDNLSNDKTDHDQDELASANHRGSKSGESKSNTPMSSQGGTSKSNTPTSTSTPLSPHDSASATASPLSSLSGGSASATSGSAAALDVAMESVDTPFQEPASDFNQNLDWNSGKPESNKNIAAVQSGRDSQETAATPVTDDGAENLEKSDVQAIIDTPTKGGVENLAFNRNTDSLFEELSSAGNDLIGDMDEGADLLDYNFLGMGREVEHLIHENTQLLETKNALNVVKNDLIAQVDELSCEREVLRGELESVSQAKRKLEEKNKELEEELKKIRGELEEAKNKVKPENEDDSDVPTAQRKRFTRVEMARVLMERNQYKERLMELQEAVRWTEMIRASKENPGLPEKKKSSLWQFFSRLFSSSGGAAKKPAVEAPVNVKYNAPTSQVQPSVKKKSSTLQQLPSDKSKAFNFLNEEVAADNVVSRREQKRAQYQQVKAHVQKEDGRVQAYGWSLPKKFKANGGQSESKMKNLPVPVFLRPLDEKDASMKVSLRTCISFDQETPDGRGQRIKVPAPVGRTELELLRAELNNQLSINQDLTIELMAERLRDQPPQEEISSQEEEPTEPEDQNLATRPRRISLWCAAGVNLSGGKTRDGGLIVGASVFYSDVPGPESPMKNPGSQSSLDKLDQDLKFSSLVWICTSTQSTTKAVVIDANQPGNILESFFVCSSHVFCITSVPGARETDYPAGEEVHPAAEAGAEGEGSSSAASSSSAEGGSVLGGITVVGCAAEGTAAVPQTADSAGRDGEPESRPAEEATEATETSGGLTDHRETLRGVYTEHVFTDPLGAQQVAGAPIGYTQRESDLLKDGVSSDPSAEDQDLMREEAQKMSSVLPTMWLGAQNGCVYVHSSVAQWKKCLHSIKLKDSVLGIVHVKGRVLVGLSDGTLAIFHRGVGECKLKMNWPHSVAVY
ncbi:hypothetical protein INR49_000921 [Caranx melampygus]|nr:hypothetical protein INR49_000921 [Caranx melampygus]